MAGTHRRCQLRRCVSLNTLSGGHPLGGMARGPALVAYSWSQYPLRRASSWRLASRRPPGMAGLVSIPSQAGILLAAIDVATRERRTCRVSIPSQAGILLAGKRTFDRPLASSVSIPSQAGILLAEIRLTIQLAVVRVSIPSQAGILLAVRSNGRSVHRMRRSQYPLRRASSWRCGNRCIAISSRDGLNTLSGGHPLGGERSRCNGTDRRVSIPSQAGILLAGRHRCDRADTSWSQYPLRRASSWREEARR